MSHFAVQVGEKNLSLCWPRSVQGLCCTDLSYGPNAPVAIYGITDGTIKNDLFTHETLEAYKFIGGSIDCSKGERMCSIKQCFPHKCHSLMFVVCFFAESLCDQQSRGSTHVNV